MYTTHHLKYCLFSFYRKIKAAAEEGALATRAHAANVYAGQAHADVMLEDALDELEPPVEPELDGHEVPTSTLQGE